MNPDNENRWKKKFYRPFLTSMPLHWCSMRLSPDWPKGTAARSWHFPGGRPVLFMDGHVGVVNHATYKGDFNWHYANSSVHAIKGDSNGDKFSMREN